MNIFKRYKLTRLPVFELNRNRKYLIAIDHRYTTVESADNLSNKLHSMGIDNAIALFDGDPSKIIRIIKHRGKL